MDQITWSRPKVGQIAWSRPVGPREMAFATLVLARFRTLQGRAISARAQEGSDTLPPGPPLLRGRCEDDEDRDSGTATTRMPLSERRQHHPARSTCADASGVRSSPLGADMVGKSRNMSADMLFMPGLLALMPPTICCVRAQSVRDFVTEISGGATPAPVRCGSEL